MPSAGYSMPSGVRADGLTRPDHDPRILHQEAALDQDNKPSRSRLCRTFFERVPETGKEEEVKVSCDEGVASHIGPEPCVLAREGKGEAPHRPVIAPRNIRCSGCRRATVVEDAFISVEVRGKKRIECDLNRPGNQPARAGVGMSCTCAASAWPGFRSSRCR